MLSWVWLPSLPEERVSCLMLPAVSAVRRSGLLFRPPSIIVRMFQAATIRQDP